MSPPERVEMPGKVMMMVNGHGTGSHRRRSEKSNAGRIGLAGALIGVLGLGAIAVTVIMWRPDDGSAPAPVRADADQSASSAVKAVGPPVTGPTLSISNTDGDAYTVAGARGGTDDAPLPGGGTPPPDGSTYGYADYVLTNTGREPALLDFPADLFVRKSRVPTAAQARCMPQAGAWADMCTLPNHSAVIGYLNGSKAPTTRDGDRYMPPGASYLIRVATDLPVSTELKQTDMNLYVWDARYIRDLKAVLVAFP